MPELLRQLFWDCDYAQITWAGHRDFVVTRVLAHGNWEAIRWLRETVGDGALREYLMAHHGKGLAPRQLRFWEVVLGIPHRTVSAWLKEPGRTVWDRRQTA